FSATCRRAGRTSRSCFSWGPCFCSRGACSWREACACRAGCFDMRPRRALLAGAGLLLAAGGALLGRGLYLEAKGALARILIERALAAHLQDGRPHRPWSWADTTPIAVLELHRLSVRRVVLEGASGTSLAFGVGHIDGTARPNSPGTCVLAGH